MSIRKLFSTVLIASIGFALYSCSGPTIKTTGYWVNREKLPPTPIKSIFVIAFTDNIQARTEFENNLAAAAQKRGLKAYKSIDVVGPVELKYIAPVKDTFLNKLRRLDVDAILTVALVHADSETKYVPESTPTYSPYSYVNYSNYGGFSPYGAYGGFGGYYGFAVGNLSSPGYYETNTKFFLETKIFDLKTDETLLSMQSKATNPKNLEQGSKMYTDNLIEEINGMNLRKK